MPTAGKKKTLVYEIHLPVYGGQDSATGREWGDHCEIYRNVGGDRECPDCGRNIHEGWGDNLERIRAQNGAMTISCCEVIVDPVTGDREVISNFNISLNLAREWLKKGSNVIDSSAQTRAFMAVAQGGGGNTILAEENATLRNEIEAMKADINKTEDK